MFTVQFNTKENQVFATSRYSQEKLRFPLSINVNQLDQNEIKSIVAQCHAMGAEGLFQRGEVMTLEDYTSEKMESINELLSEYKAEKKMYFKFPEKIHVSMFYNKHGVLRIVAGKGYLKGGCTVYDLPAFMEFSNALECDMPLTMDKATSAMKTPLNIKKSQITQTIFGLRDRLICTGHMCLKFALCLNLIVNDVCIFDKNKVCSYR